MPIVHVQAPRLASEEEHAKLLDELTTALSEASGMAPKSIRCTYSATLAQSRGTPEGTVMHGDEATTVYIDVLQGPAGAVSGEALERVARTAAAQLGLELDQVWVRFVPLPEGTVFRGGKLF